MHLKVVKNGAGNWALDNGKNYMEASCHHRKNGRGHSACGGCYARAVEVLKHLADAKITDAVAFIQALKDEAKR